MLILCTKIGIRISYVFGNDYIKWTFGVCYKTVIRVSGMLAGVRLWGDHSRSCNQFSGVRHFRFSTTTIPISPTNTSTLGPKKPTCISHQTRDQQPTGHSVKSIINHCSARKTNDRYMTDHRSAKATNDRSPVSQWNQWSITCQP